MIYDDQGGALAAARVWWMVRAVGHDSVAVLDGGLQAAALAGLAISEAVAEVRVVEPYPLPGGSVWGLPTRDAADVERTRRDPRELLLDVRAPERFRGEAEPLDPVAGHIPGAVNAPYRESLDAEGWFRAAADLERLYRELLGGREPARVTVYCGSGVTACHCLLALEHAGLPGAALYVGSWGEWCRNPWPRASVRRAVKGRR